MSIYRIVFGIALLFLSSCVSNPINKVTSNNYSKTCATAEQRGELKVAEDACDRALVNTDWGNLSEELKSEKLYNLARIKRRLAKFSEAESLLNESLKIEKSTSSKINTKIGRRLVELSVNLAAQDKWEEGANLLEKVIPITNKYSGKEKQFIITVLNEYGKHFNGIGNIKKARYFISKANEV